MTVDNSSSARGWLEMNVLLAVVQTEGLLVCEVDGSVPLTVTLEDKVVEEADGPADVNIVESQDLASDWGELGGSEPDLVRHQEQVGGQEEQDPLIWAAQPAGRETEEGHHQML